MSMPPGERDLTQRPLLKSFEDYPQVQQAVDQLSAANFPVEAVTIVGVDLKMVESILGRTSWARAAVGGLAMFAWLGILLGLFVSFFGGQDASPLTYMLLGLLYGAGFGIVFGLVSYAFTSRNHDFVSRQNIRASRYDLLCEQSQLNAARQALGMSTVWPPPLPESGETQSDTDASSGS
ncbi:MAG: hypothetical protein KDC39_13215 [Actinobacteria bacterium]|nr:hypothetical protein [Actinomycetota bacterium]